MKASNCKSICGVQGETEFMVVSVLVLVFVFSDFDDFLLVVVVVDDVVVDVAAWLCRQGSKPKDLNFWQIVRLSEVRKSFAHKSKNPRKVIPLFE